MAEWCMASRGERCWIVRAEAGDPSLLHVLVDGQATTVRQRGAWQELALAVPEAGAPWLVWTEYRDDLWRLCAGQLLEDEPGLREELMLLVETPEQLASPAAAWSGTHCLITWVQRLEGVCRAVLGRLEAGGGWRSAGPMSTPGMEAAAPALAIAGGRIYLAWESYETGTHRLGWATMRLDFSHGTRTRQGGGASGWRYPTLAVRKQGVVLAWQMLLPVAMHALETGEQPMLCAARIDGRKWQTLEREGAQALVDLRSAEIPGLEVPAAPPRLLVLGQHTWLLWEVQTPSAGAGTAALVGMASKHLRRWSEPQRLATGGRGYRVAPAPAGRMHIACLTRDATVQLTTLDPAAARVWQSASAPAGWDAWIPAWPAPLLRPNLPMTLAGRPCSCYWLALLSEESRELPRRLRFLRDVIGLDGAILTAAQLTPGDLAACQALDDERFRVLRVPVAEALPVLPMERPKAPDRAGSAPSLLIGIWAEALTDAALIDGLLAGRTVSSQGFACFADLRVGDAGLGECVTCTEPPELRADVRAPDAIARLELWEGDRCVHTTEPQTLDGTFRWRPPALPPGEHRYHLRMRLMGPEDDPYLRARTGDVIVHYLPNPQGAPAE